MCAIHNIGSAFPGPSRKGPPWTPNTKGGIVFGPFRSSSARRGASSVRDIRLWSGALLIVGSAVGANAYVQGIAQRSPAYVLVRPVAQGTEIVLDDVRRVGVALPAGVDVIGVEGDVVGQVAARDLAAGELVTLAAVSAELPLTVRIMSLPVRAGHLPELQHGAIVEVWATPTTQGMELPGPARLVVDRAVVVAAPEVVDATADTSITLQVAAADVPALATAMRDGVLDVAWLAGAK